MGYYIELPENHGKADQIIELYGAEEIQEPEEWRTDKAIICVIDNGLFEAAALCYSPQELNRFIFDGTNRPKQWLAMDLKKACELTGYPRNP